MKLSEQQREAIAQHRERVAAIARNARASKASPASPRSDEWTDVPKPVEERTESRILTQPGEQIEHANQ